MKTIKKNGDRRAVDYNDICTIVFNDTMHQISAIRENYQAGILKQFKKWF